MQALVAFLIVRFVIKNDIAGAIESNPVIGIRQVFRSQPKIQRMFSHDFESEPGSDRWSAAVNPALTIMANAMRVGNHLIERMK